MLVEFVPNLSVEIDASPRYKFRHISDMFRALADVDWREAPNVTEVMVGPDCKVTMRCVLELSQTVEDMSAMAEALRTRFDRQALKAAGLPEELDEELVRSLVEARYDGEIPFRYRGKHVLELARLLEPEEYLAAA